MKQSRLTQHLNKVRKELTAKSSGEIAMDVVGSDVAGLSVEASRVFSEDSSHYFLIKGLRQFQDAANKTEVVDSYHQTEGQEQCSELNDLMISTQKDNNYDDTDMGLKSSVRDFQLISKESLKAALSFANSKIMVPTDSGSVDLSSEETDSSDDSDRREKITAVKQKRKMPLDMNADEKKPKLAITDTCCIVLSDTSENEETKTKMNSKEGRETENVRAVEKAKSLISPFGDLAEDKAENKCTMAVVSKLSPNISADLKDVELSPVCLSGIFQEEIPAVVDVKSESESSDGKIN